MDELESEMTVAREAGRFRTSEKGKAFAVMTKLKEKEKIYTGEDGKTHRKTWRVGITIRNNIILDLDSHDQENLKDVKMNYENLLGINFQVIQTNGGFHLISKESFGKEEWKYKMMQIIFPMLQKSYVHNFELLLREEFSKNKSEDRKLNSSELAVRARKMGEKFKECYLFQGYGNFDIRHTLISILKGYSVLRISKKSKNDKMELIEKL